MNIIRATILITIFMLNLSYEQTAERPNIWRMISQMKNGKEKENLEMSKKPEEFVNGSKGEVDTLPTKVKNLMKNKPLMKYFFMDKKSPKKSSFQSRTRTGRLGNSCVHDGNCGSGSGQVCVNNICECHSRYVQHNDTHCLPGVLLGFSCLSHGQCRLRVPNSSCIQGFCRCGAGSLPYRRANCLQASKLGESCRTHAQCSLVTTGSHCKWVVKNVLGKCQCKADMPKRGDKCGPSGFALGAPCGKSYDCSKHVPGSVCVALRDADEETSSHHSVGLSSSRGAPSNEIVHYSFKAEGNLSLGGVCRCPPGYLAIKNDTRCVPVKKEIGIQPISLGKPCSFSSQCEASDPYSSCIDGHCECVAPSDACSAVNTGCRNETFQCYSDGRCISGDFVCDGNEDCKDGSDESFCFPGRCPHQTFTCKEGTCLGRARVCDGTPDCPDESDEIGCHSNEEKCPATSFRCSDGSCLPGFEFCNAFASCKDGSDEDKMTCIGGMLNVPECPFRCKNGRCRSLSVLCSGKDGCGDNSDEENCSVCNCPKP